MKNHAPGSILLITILIIASLHILCVIVWRTTAFTHTLALSKQQHNTYQQWKEGVIHGAIQLCKNHFLILEAHMRLDSAAEEITLQLPFPSCYAASIIFERHTLPNTIHMTISFLEKGKQKEQREFCLQAHTSAQNQRFFEILPCHQSI